jgi:hypothetical protein
MCQCTTPTSLVDLPESLGALIFHFFHSPFPFSSFVVIYPYDSGNLVVSMRPLTSSDAIKAVELTARFPRVHGSPIHIGDPVLCSS